MAEANLEASNDMYVCETPCVIYNQLASTLTTIYVD